MSKQRELVIGVMIADVSKRIVALLSAHQGAVAGTRGYPTAAVVKGARQTNEIARELLKEMADLVAERADPAVTERFVKIKASVDAAITRFDQMTKPSREHLS